MSDAWQHFCNLMRADHSDPFSGIPSNFFLVSKLFCPTMSASIKSYFSYADHVPLENCSYQAINCQGSCRILPEV